MRLSEALLLEVPNGLPTDHAALTEPMAVGVHAVAKARLEPDDAPLVIGCGPVGLAVIAALRLAGVRPIVAADSPRRGASWRWTWAPTSSSIPRRPRPGRAGARRRSGPTRRGRRAASVASRAAAAPGRGLRVRRCPGVLDQLMAAAPRGSRIVVVGVCMEADAIYPMLGITKELNLQFVLGYTPEEFAATLRHIAEGAIPRRR